jgi:hypothetical protein
MYGRIPRRADNSTALVAAAARMVQEEAVSYQPSAFS